LVQRLRGQPLYAKVILAMFTGLRRAELLALRWSHVDLDAKSIVVREAIEETRAGLRLKPPKSKAGKREIALPDIVVETLRDHRRRQLEQRLQLGLGKLPDALLFSRLDGSPESPWVLSKQWARAATALGLAVTFHALRHTHVSMLIDAGIDVVKISKRLGHANVSTTLDVYAHLFVAREDKSAQAINDAVAALFSA
jgi:integrase